jgi:hypothetical protein
MSGKVLIELQYLPSVQYFSKLLAYEQLIIEQWENYQKGSYRNRCHIAGANGLQILSVPLEKGKHQKLPIQEVRIAYRQPWHLQHWRSIRSAYANAPFFPYYSEAFEAIYLERPQFLFELNRQLLELCCRHLGLQDKVNYSGEYRFHPEENVHDLRGFMLPREKGEEADPHFQAVPYPQVFTEKHGFLPNLSILDLLFCTGPEAAQILRSSIF